jgi:hypothetical protein
MPHAFRLAQHHLQNTQYHISTAMQNSLSRHTCCLFWGRWRPSQQCAEAEQLWQVFFVRHDPAKTLQRPGRETQMIPNTSRQNKQPVCLMHAF